MNSSLDRSVVYSVRGEKDTEHKSEEKAELLRVLLKEQDTKEQDIEYDTIRRKESIPVE